MVRKKNNEIKTPHATVIINGPLRSSYDSETWAHQGARYDIRIIPAREGLENQAISAGAVHVPFKPDILLKELEKELSALPEEEQSPRTILAKIKRLTKEICAERHLRLDKWPAASTTIAAGR
ncbi:MAG: hypothetical protein KGJ06_04185 [Pseudomonadota bacterium]|nr:hypothetical protein [Pseudomonadota bacterium]